MRSASTSRPSRHVRSQAAAEPVVISRSHSGRHSLCQAPAARSCSCDHRVQQRGDEARRLLGAAERGDRGDRVALVRHRGRAAGRGLAHLADLGLGEQRDVARGLADRARGDAERAGELADPAAQGVPRDRRHVEAELAREPADDRAAGPGRAPSSVPRRAAELRRRQADAVQVVGGVVEAQHPARGLEPERRRLGLLEQRAADDRRVAVALGERRGRVRRRTQVAQQRRQRALGHQHRGGVDRVLARRAVVHGRVGQLPQPLDHRPGRVPDLGRFRADRVDVEAVELRGGDDRLGVIDDARLRLRARERDLEVEQRLQPGAAARPARRRRRGRARPRRRQSLKKTVSRSPWRCTSKR